MTLNPTTGIPKQPSTENAETCCAIERPNRVDVALCLALLIAAVVIFGKGITVGGPRWGDAGVHAMDGVLIHDWIAAGPAAWSHPVEYAERQYAHYPSLGIGTTYPPGFAVAESLFFSVFGISTVTARACVVVFGLIAVVGLYVLVRPVAGRLAAVCSIVALLAMPSTVFWTRQIMLEMPTLSVLIWSAVAAMHYLKRPTHARLLLWIALSVSAVMFKQTALFIFMPNAILLSAWCARKTSPWRHILLAGVLSFVAIGSYVYFVMLHGARAPLQLEVVLKDQAPSALLTWENWTAYLRWWPSQMGWGVLVLSCLGCVRAVWRWNRLYAMLMLWIVSFYAMSSIVQHKHERYFFFGFVPFAVCTGVGVAWLAAGVRSIRIRWAAVVTPALSALLLSYRVPIEYRPDYTPLIAAHREKIQSGLVLFDGQRDSDFVFALRQVLGPRQCVAMRASKLLYTCAAEPGFRYESYVDSLDDVNHVLTSLAFDTIFIERYPKMNLKEERLLRESLRTSGDYALSSTHSLLADPSVPTTRMSAVTVDVFLPLRPMTRTVKDVLIHIPMDNRTVEVDLDELL